MIEINKIFYSEKSKTLHNKCVFCEENVLEYQHGYVIEKAFKYNEANKNYELIFEYALCSECLQRLSSEMSEESTKKLEKYFKANRTDVKNLQDIDERLKKCTFTEEDINKSAEYQIGGFFVKNKMLISQEFPFVIGGIAIEEIQSLISEKTQKFSDTFKDLILPPDVRKNLPKDRIVIF